MILRLTAQGRAAELALTLKRPALARSGILGAIGQGAFHRMRQCSGRRRREWRPHNGFGHQR